MIADDLEMFWMCPFATCFVFIVCFYLFLIFVDKLSSRAYLHNQKNGTHKVLAFFDLLCKTLSILLFLLTFLFSPWKGSRSATGLSDPLATGAPSYLFIYFYFFLVGNHGAPLSLVQHALGHLQIEGPVNLIVKNYISHHQEDVYVIDSEISEDYGLCSIHIYCLECILYENFECMKNDQRTWQEVRILVVILVLRNKTSLKQVIAKAIYYAT